MKHPRRFSNAFTIIELLTVIAIIGILAAMVLAALASVRKGAQKAKAKTEIQGIITAIRDYDTAYGHFPVSDAAQSQAIQNAEGGGNPDFTYGGTFQTPVGATSIGTTVNGSVMSNAEVIAILMDWTNYPGGGPTPNANHIKNLQQHHFLNIHLSGWNPSLGGDPQPGIGSDLVYRDPWGNPYVITMDLNDDETCLDALYRTNAISSGGLNGLIQSPAVPPPHNWAYRGKVMVWSAGPDRKIDPATPANQGANRDNILSWK